MNTIHFRGHLKNSVFCEKLTSTVLGGRGGMEAKIDVLKRHLSRFVKEISKINVHKCRLSGEGGGGLERNGRSAFLAEH